MELSSKLRGVHVLRALRPDVADVIFVLSLLISVASSAYALTTTTVTLTSSPNPANYGQSVTLTANVASAATGKITFYDGTTVLGVSSISGGAASLTTIMLPSGTRSLHAYYG